MPHGAMTGAGPVAGDSSPSSTTVATAGPVAPGVSGVAANAPAGAGGIAYGFGKDRRNRGERPFDRNSTRSNNSFYGPTAPVPRPQQQQQHLPVQQQLTLQQNLAAAQQNSTAVPAAAPAAAGAAGGGGGTGGAPNRSSTSRPAVAGPGAAGPGAAAVAVSGAGGASGAAYPGSFGARLSVDRRLPQHHHHHHHHHPSQPLGSASDELSLSLSSSITPCVNHVSALTSLAEGNLTVRLFRHPLSGSYVRAEWLPEGAPAAGAAAKATRGSHFRENPRERQLATVLPVEEVRRMSPCHWNETYVLERRYAPRDWSAESECAVLGHRQPHVTRDHRHRIVKWMSEACILFRWTSQTFFTAVHAWDVYMTSVRHLLGTGDLAKLSAACLYFGAQLVESAADENVKTLDEFTEMCPEVGTAAALREIQAHLVDTLQGVSLVRRTPTDFLLLFLAQLQVAPAPAPQLYQTLVHQRLLLLAWEVCQTLALVVYTNGLVLDGLPGSCWVAGGLLRVLEFACPALRTDAAARETLLHHVFHLSAAAFDSLQTTILDPIVKAVWTAVTGEENAASTAAAGGAGGGGVGSVGASGPAAAAASVGKAHDIVKHWQPATFGSWTTLLPASRTVQDVVARLRATSFDTATPPYLPTLLLSASAVKRGPRKTGSGAGGGGGGGAGAAADFASRAAGIAAAGHPQIGPAAKVPLQPHPTPEYPVRR